MAKTKKPNSGSFGSTQRGKVRGPGRPRVTSASVPTAADIEADAQARYQQLVDRYVEGEHVEELPETDLILKAANKTANELRHAVEAKLREAEFRRRQRSLGMARGDAKRATEKGDKVLREYEQALSDLQKGFVEKFKKTETGRATKLEELIVAIGDCIEAAPPEEYIGHPCDATKLKTERARIGSDAGEALAGSNGNPLDVLRNRTTIRVYLRQGLPIDGYRLDENGELESFDPCAEAVAQAEAVVKEMDLRLSAKEHEWGHRDKVAWDKATKRLFRIAEANGHEHLRVYSPLHLTSDSFDGRVLLTRLKQPEESDDAGEAKSDWPPEPKRVSGRQAVWGAASEFELPKRRL
jgi:hypothetical protein